MEEIIQRLDPDKVADILLPKSGQIVQPFLDELLADKPKAIKEFAVVASKKFWQDMSFHGLCFCLVVVLVQLSNEND